MEFAHTRCSAVGVQKFVNKYGLLHGRKAISVDEVVADIRRMRAAIRSWEAGRTAGDVSRFVNEFNSTVRSIITVELAHSVDPVHPQFKIVPLDLCEAMWLQLAQIVSSKQGLKRCDWCPTWFLYGSGTGRRNSALYCSDKCRKAAHKHRGASQK